MIAEAVLGTWVASYATVAVVARYRARRDARAFRAHVDPPQWPRVVILRPCAGAEPALAGALGSTAQVCYEGHVDAVFSVADARDTAWEIVRAAAEGNVNASAMLAPARHLNHKVGQLATVLDRLDLGDDDVLAVVDSDVDLAGYDLSALVRPLLSERDRAAATWSPPHEVADSIAPGDRFSRAIMGASLQSFSLLGPLDGTGLVGKTFAMRARTLRQIGGMGSFGVFLAEDMEIARRLVARHGTIAMNPAPTRSLAQGRSVRAVLVRFTRWLLALKVQRRGLLWTYPLLLAAAPVLIVASAILGIGINLWAGIVGLGVTIVARLFVARWASGGGSRRSSVTDIAMADILLLAAAARAAMTQSVRWRGRKLDVDASGRLGAGNDAMRPNKRWAHESPDALER